jgi:hypothetical protein
MNTRKIACLREMGEVVAKIEETTVAGRHDSQHVPPHPK